MHKYKRIYILSKTISSPIKLSFHHLILGILISVMLLWKQSHNLIESSPIPIPDHNVHSQRCVIFNKIQAYEFYLEVSKIEPNYWSQLIQGQMQTAKQVRWNVKSYSISCFSVIKSYIMIVKLYAPLRVIGSLLSLFGLKATVRKYTTIRHNNNGCI